MLERATGCLKAGGQRLLCSAPKSARTRRSLHSSFWCHGAGDIDLPSWWISLLQQPPPAKSSHLQSIADTAKQCLSAGLLDGGFLDFLYPAKTLTLIHKLAVRDAHHPRTRTHKQAGQYAVRAFTSVAADDRVATESDFDHAMELVSTIQKNGHSVLDADMECVQKVVREPLSVVSKAKERQLRILAERKAAYEQAWQKFCDMHDGVTASDAKKRRKSVKRVNKKGLDYVFALFRCIPRPRRKKLHYDLAIRLASGFHGCQIALRIYREARIQNKVTLPMTAQLIRVAIESQQAKVAFFTFEGWKRYARRRGWRAGDLAFAELDNMKLTSLMMAAVSATNVIKEAKSTRTAFTTNYRAFVVRVIGRALSRRIQEFSLDWHAEMWSALKSLTTPTSPFISSALTQLLYFKDDTHLNAAIDLYHAARGPTVKVSKSVLEELLARLMEVHKSPDLYMVFNDLKENYGTPPIALFEKVLGELSSQGEASAFHEGFQEFRAHFGNQASPTLYQKLLNVHFRRLEIRKVDESFAALSTEYGFTPTIDCWNTVIAAHARISDLKGALEWHQRLLESGLKLDAVSFATLMNMYAARGDIQPIENLITKCEEQGIKLTTSMVDSLVVVHIKNGDIDEARSLVENALQLDLAGSRTHMWNCVLSGLALKREVAQVQVVHSRMQEAGIPSDSETWGAILQSLCVAGQATAAFNVLRGVMPRQGIRPTALHFAVIFRGLIKTKQYGRLFLVAKYMVSLDIKTSFSVQRILVRAAALMDRRESRDIKGPDDAYESPRAEALLSRGLEIMDASELAAHEPVLGVGTQRLDEAYISNYFDSLINVYGQEGNFPKAIETYDRYHDAASAYNPGTEVSPPINILTALMMAHFRQGNHEEVENCWYLAMGKAEDLARRTGADLAEPKWVLRSRRFTLNLPLLHYMRSLVEMDRVDDIEPLVDQLEEAGYALTNLNWNVYVQCLAICRPPRAAKAFRLCEEELMIHWTGWREKGGHGPSIRKSVEIAQPSLYNQWKRIPNYRTFVYLAGAYMHARSKHAFTGLGNPVLQQIHREAPLTVKAVHSMPKVDDTLQIRILRGT